ncbi:hypothetical protein OIU85_007451 [Salix viminalis]|uniref:Uncharacterized protein n=1 Tax=Salix viminalis TaxID=40686 RepID=A0A9Q0P8S0_SALVM|nr:hypothetical protein OIU85_007451 [Salix viminalis]
MEARLVEYFANEFNKQVGNGVGVRKFPKAMGKLKKQVKRTKEILSVAPISVESLYDDRDFSSVDSTQFINFFLFMPVFLQIKPFSCIWIMKSLYVLLPNNP